MSLSQQKVTGLMNSLSRGGGAVLLRASQLWLGKARPRLFVHPMNFCFGCRGHHDRVLRTPGKVCGRSDFVEIGCPDSERTRCVLCVALGRAAVGSIPEKFDQSDTNNTEYVPRSTRKFGGDGAFYYYTTHLDKA